MKRELWPNTMTHDGKALTWEDAMPLFVDRTGLPGPREWSNQNFPDGKADHPVTGVSWYEAAAYAKFRGKQLPTVFEWERAARNGKIAPAGLPYMPWGVLYPGISTGAPRQFRRRARIGDRPCPSA